MGYGSDLDQVACCSGAVTPSGCADRGLRSLMTGDSLMFWGLNPASGLSEPKTSNHQTMHPLSAQALGGNLYTNLVCLCTEAFVWKAGRGRSGIPLPEAVPAAECLYPSTGEKKCGACSPLRVRVTAQGLSPRNPNTPRWHQLSCLPSTHVT